MQTQTYDYDYVVIGSGFGGSVSAYRLSQKGYKVLVIERGKWYQAADFPKTNWQFKKWLWLPLLKLHGITKLTFFRHISVLSGSGVGGGSLVYAATLPVPSDNFFQHGSWQTLADWKTELEPYYKKAMHMLGRTTNTKFGPCDEDFKSLAKELDIEDQFSPNPVGIYLGEAGVEHSDPFFEGEGPARTGCIHCGECMTGCRYNAKNSLDKNYLHLAQKNGAQVLAERNVIDVKPLAADDGSQGYVISHQASTKILKGKAQEIRSRGVIFSGGVIGSIKLLLKLKARGSLPRLSEQLGKRIRTNNEAIIMVTSRDEDVDRSKGLAIGSIIHVDENTHIEPTRYGAGSGAWRILTQPMIEGRNVFLRLGNLVKDWATTPVQNLKMHFAKDWAKQTNIVLFMQSIDSTLQFKVNRLGMMVSSLEQGTAPTPFIPQALDIGRRLARIINGKPTSMVTETITGIPSTAHILGGATMGEDINNGVIDKYNRVFGYKNMLVCDGSAISANPGVNPSLSITALTEHAMDNIAAKTHDNAP